MLCVSHKKERKKEKWGTGLNKAVGFAQRSCKIKWAQSKRPGEREGANRAALSGKVSD